MPYYLDSGSGQDDQFIGNWLNANIADGIKGFRVQMGYFRYGALAAYAPTLAAAAQAGHPVHFVLGANDGNLTASDLEQTFQVVLGCSNASLTIVSYADAKFHPKTIHIVRSDDSIAAIVGSSNFTTQGLGKNVEASLMLDSRADDSIETLTQIAVAADRWRSTIESGIFPIQAIADIQVLVDAGIINRPQPILPSLPPAPNTAAAQTRRMQGRRRQQWKPLLRRTRRTAKPRTAAKTPSSAPKASISALRWCKQLTASDAQKNTGHKTAQLRLTKSGFDIQHTTYFRSVMFGFLSWNSETKRSHQYEVTQTNFQVAIAGKPLGSRTLKIHYAPHQEQSQHNYTSVIYWDEELKQELNATSYTGNWVVIERDTAGKFSLTIQASKPAWSP